MTNKISDYQRKPRDDKVILATFFTAIAIFGLILLEVTDYRIILEAVDAVVLAGVGIAGIYKFWQWYFSRKRRG